MTVDARGYSCPMPVVMVQKAVKADAPATLEVLLRGECHPVCREQRLQGRRGAGGSGLPSVPVQMSRYIATFHTHLSALLTCQRLTAAGVRARMMPVPRKLSASCGTCVDYEASGPMLEQMDTDVERVFAVAGETYTLLLENE